MSASGELTLPNTADVTVQESVKTRSTWWRRIVAIWKTFLGAVFCQSPIGALIAAGWTQRLVQRSAIKQLWKLSPNTDQGSRFSHWIHSSPDHPAHHHFPNWILAQNYRESSRRRHGESSWRWILRLPMELVRSLATNLSQGIQLALTTWLFTLPGCALWAFAWYAGWNNSFNKGYEYASIGPSTYVLGIVLFVGAMLYVPYAQARQAITGNWRSFFAFRMIWQISRRNAMATLWLAALYSALGLFVMILKTMPEFFPQIAENHPEIFPNLLNATPAEAQQLLSTYFFWAAIPVLGCFIWLRTMAGRTYTRGLVDGVRTGRIPHADLDPAEHSLLQEFDLLETKASEHRHALVRAAIVSTSTTARAALMTATVLVWITFTFSIIITEFLNYHPGHGWLNQPLIHIPWFNYAPGEPSEPTSDLLR